MFKISELIFTIGIFWFCVLYLGVITCKEPGVIGIYRNFTRSPSGLVCTIGNKIIIDQVKTYHVHPDGNKAFTDTSTFSNMLFDLCSRKSKCSLGEKRIEGSQYKQWIAEVKFSCYNEVFLRERFMSICDYRGSLNGTSGDLMYEFKTGIQQTMCNCNITGVSETTIREYRPYYNSSCIDGFLEVNEESFQCRGNALWKNNIFNRRVNLAGTLKVNLNLHDGRGPKRLWIYIKGRDINVSCASISLLSTSSVTQLWTSVASPRDVIPHNPLLSIAFSVSEAVALVLLLAVTVLVCYKRQRCQNFKQESSTEVQTNDEFVNEDVCSTSLDTNVYTVITNRNKMKSQEGKAVQINSLKSKTGIANAYDIANNFKNQDSEYNYSEACNTYSHLGDQRHTSQTESTYNYFQKQGVSNATSPKEVSDGIYNTTSSQEKELSNFNDTYSHI